jgi:divalent metal cation (Fe/Co/Zn/Cd) transporter
MPDSIESFAYAWMSALIVLGLAVIAWLLNKGFETIKEVLNRILDALSSEKEERMAVNSKLEAHIAACEARRAVDPHLHHRITDLHPIAGD